MNAVVPFDVDPVAGLLNALTRAGIVPSDPAAIVADGRVRRFHVEGDRRGARNGWCVLHPDHGAAGHWRTGARVTWSSRGDKPLTREQRRALNAAMLEARRQRDAEQQAAHERAAGQAAAWWKNARPADPGHRYLAAKGIPPGIAQQTGDELILPLYDVDGRLWSLQRIAPDGSKRLLSGGAKRGRFIPVAGDPHEAAAVLIAEGFATTMSVHLLALVPGAAHVAAVDCGNLLPVAQAIRRLRPDVRIVIAADDDRLTQGNPGLTAAREAAVAVGGEVLRPRWPHGAPLALSDFNDLMLWQQREGVRHG